MAVNKVNFGGNTLIDLTGDTLESAEQLLKGIIAHAKDGSVITGQMEAGGGGKYVTGSFSVASDSYSSYTIEHNLGVIPTFALIYAEDATVISGSRYVQGGGFLCTNPLQDEVDGIFFIKAMGTPSASYFSVSCNYNNGGKGLVQSMSGGSGTYFNSLSEKKMKFLCNYYSYTATLIPGIEYKYLCGVF